MQEKWNKCNFIIDNFGKMYLEELTKRKGEMELILRGELHNTVVKILFDGEVLSFRCSDEGRRIKTINDLDKVYGLDFYKNQNYFIIENSEYIKRFNEETYDIYKNFNIVHYVFILSDDIIDILSTFPPIIEVLG